jgi:hypothetical protein
VDAEEETSESVTYFSPAGIGEKLFGSSFSPQYPLTFANTQLKIKARQHSDLELLATLTLPHTNPKDPKRYSSAISNPPGIATGYPAITLHRYGEGKVIYAAGDLEGVDNDAHREVFGRMIQHLESRPMHFASDAPKAVEITLFRDDQNGRFLIHLLNFQHELPNIPVECIRIRLKLNGRVPVTLFTALDETPIAFETKEDYIEFQAPKLDTYQLLLLQFEYVE